MRGVHVNQTASAPGPSDPPWPWWQRDESSTPTRPVWTRARDAPEGFRPVDPPRWVWVDLRAALRKDAFTFTDEDPGGLQYRYEAKGLLRAWMPAVDGSALALVTYQLLTADLAWRTTVTAFVPAHTVRFRSRTGRETR
ncbi:hypothetical protein B1813_01370 [Saccharomonospora piscinae]|uniref:Uncharacterized protein n=1 Tax=Saccharomonospora piscinae TaxID=687388 RepID=A0A1V9ACF4_SACPI|nr:hypothetical protein B1813_01370 [Saccharomonospora piscinae]